MIRNIATVILFSLVAVLADTSVVHGDITRQIPVTDEFIEGSFGLSGAAGGMEYRVKIIVANNMIEFCGAVAYTNPQARSAYRAFLRDSAFLINGQKVLKDMTYWNTANHRAWGSAKANCRSTGVPANAKIDSIDMDWSSKTHRY